MVVPGVREPRRVRCGVTAIGAMKYGPCQRNHDTAIEEGHLVSTANGQGMAPHERSPPSDGREHSRIWLKYSSPIVLADELQPYLTLWAHYIRGWVLWGSYSNRLLSHRVTTAGSANSSASGTWRTQCSTAWCWAAVVQCSVGSGQGMSLHSSSK